jgi:4,5-DOPA dioxygenase extradiol
MLPTIFFGHGSPMNAIEKNSYTEKWIQMTAGVSTPQAIVMISAHWQTRGTLITGSSHLSTIHDFGGFSDELSHFEYSARGYPELARSIAITVGAELDMSRGLDHGVWSVLAQIYPGADIPVLQLSLDYTKTAKEHFELGQQLSYLRNEGVLIIGSGDIVHNLGLINWRNNSHSTWASEFDSVIVENIQSRNFGNIIDYPQYGEIAMKSIPTPEHYWPLLYVLGASVDTDQIEIFNQEILMGAVSMTSVKFIDESS